MITKKSNQTGKLRTVPVFSDLGMLIEFYQSKIWKDLARGDRKAYWKVFLWLIALKVEMFALILRSLFQFNFGRHTSGILLGIWTLSMLIAINANAIEGYLFTIIPFGAPVLLINMEWSTFLDIIWFNARSQKLAICVAVFAALHTIHIVRIYLSKGEKDDHMKRGSSWIYRLIPRISFLTEFKIQCFIEPILGLLLAYLFWYIDQDFWIAIVLTISSLCLFIQAFIDRAFQYYHELN